MTGKTMFRVTERYYDNGKTTATIKEVPKGTPMSAKTHYPNFDQYQYDHTTIEAARANVKATLEA